MSGRVSAIAAVAALLLPAAAPGAGEPKPGAYCPLPEEGAPRECLTPAQDRYGSFFRALEHPAIEDTDVALVERDLASGHATERAYLALSTLSYGYYRLSQRVASSPDADPAMVARLERWNALLARAFEEHPEDAPFRAALREAALDIQRRAPPVRLACADARGDPAECDSTEAVIRGFNEATGRVGIRGALERLLRRITGGAGGDAS